MTSSDSNFSSSSCLLLLFLLLLLLRLLLLLLLPLLPQGEGMEGAYVLEYVVREMKFELFLEVEEMMGRTGV